MLIKIRWFSTLALLCCALPCMQGSDGSSLDPRLEGLELRRRLVEEMRAENLKDGASGEIENLSEPMFDHLPPIVLSQIKKLEVRSHQLRNANDWMSHEWTLIYIQKERRWASLDRNLLKLTLEAFFKDMEVSDGLRELLTARRELLSFDSEKVGAMGQKIYDKMLIESAVRIEYVLLEESLN